MLVRKKQGCYPKSSLDKSQSEKSRDTSHFGLIDWDFKTESSRTYIHDICWYPSRFIPIIPAQLISSLSSRNDTILDPFCGAGTTAVEALKAGRNSISADLNPIACYLTRVKAALLLTEKQKAQELSELLEHLRSLRAADTPYPQLFDSSPHYCRALNASITTPNIAENKGWYHPRTLAELTYIHHLVADLTPGILQELAKTLFISILMAATGHRTGRSYTYYADNVKPKGELLYKDSIKLYCAKLGRFLHQYSSTSLRLEPTLTSEVYECNICNLDEVLRSECDLIITSPPYLGVSDYATGFRLAYLWHDFVPNIKVLKAAEIGARYRRHQNPTRALEGYKRDLDRAARQMVQFLKPRGYLCLVLGEPRRYYSEIWQFVVELLGTHYKLSLQDAFTRQISKNFFSIHAVVFERKKY